MTDTPERIWARPVGTVRDWNHTCGPWSLDNPYGSSVEYIRADIAEAEKRAEVAAVCEKAEVLCQQEIDRGDKNAVLAYAGGARTCRDAIRALSDTDALAEYVERERADAVEVARQTIWDALNGSQQAEQLCDAIDAAIRQEAVE
jgi:hypothetical protein